MLTIEQLITRDALNLDTVKPDWFERVDVSELDLTSTDCILFQVFGDHVKGITELGYDRKEYVSDNGFVMWQKEASKYNSTTEEATELWRREVRTRLVGVGSIEELVARDAAKLDEVDPGWYEYVNTDELNIATSKCILFQLFGGHHTGINFLGYSLTKGEKMNAFWIGGKECDIFDTSPHAVTEMWRKEIQKRRNV